MLESILRQAGYRTGFYTSPYLEDFCERIQVSGVYIPGERLAAITQRVKAVADDMDDHPSQFEIVTAIGMVYFAEEHCDIVILEVGMGGLLDSTNIIDAPEVAVITNITLEHTEYLGDTIEKISMAKAGIIKEGCAVVCYNSAPEVTHVIAQVCHEKGAHLRVADFSQISLLSCDLSGQQFLWRGQKFSLPLLGEHQLHNVAVVLETVLALVRGGWLISVSAVQKGLAQVVWAARFEVLSEEPLFILDGGHNLQCVQALVDGLVQYLHGKRFTFIVGFLEDKDYGAMLDAVMPYVERFFCLTPDNPRAVPAKKLAQEIAMRYPCIPVSACCTPAEAISKSWQQGSPTVAFGSLYMAGTLRREYIAK